MKKIFLILFFVTFGLALSNFVWAGCCSTNCSAVESSCSPSNWYSDLDCTQVGHCAEEADDSSSSSTTSESENSSVVSSQCAIVNADGSQSGCTHDNDTAVLDQCSEQGFSGVTCSSVENYLQALADDCSSSGGSGVNCSMITSGGYYGAAASAYAAYMEGGSSSGTTTSSASGNLEFPTDSGLPDPAGGIVGIATGFLNWILGLVGMVAIISFAISGFQYFLAAGDEGQVETAKRNMKYSIFGVIIALAGFVVIRAVDAALNASALF